MKAFLMPNHRETELVTVTFCYTVKAKWKIKFILNEEYKNLEYIDIEIKSANNFFLFP